MIIGPDFVFLHVPRCAGTLMQRVYLPQFGGKFHNPFHGRIVPADHAHKFTFAIVREPYSRMMSLWAHWQIVTTNVFLREQMRDPSECAERFFTGESQVEFLSASRIDRVLHYERLAEEVLNLPFNKYEIRLPVEKVNRSKVEWPEMTDRFIKAVNTACREDFEKYGYEMRI